MGIRRTFAGVVPVVRIREGEAASRGAGRAVPCRLVFWMVEIGRGDDQQ